MTNLVLSKHVDAPVETVFDVATDLEHAPGHIRGIEKIELLTPGPIGVGTRWRETRKMMGREATEVLEIKAFDRPHGYTAGCESCGSYLESAFQFVPENGATRLCLEMRMEARGMFAKLMAPLGKLLFGKMMRKCLDGDLEDIKRTAESRTTAPTAP